MTPRRTNQTLLPACQRWRRQPSREPRRHDASRRAPAGRQQLTRGVCCAWIAMPASPPPNRPSNNLPLQLTSFIGREREIATVKAQLTRSRLVTLTGAGGSGKTRLAIQVAADLLESIAGGVWFVDLAPLSEESVLPQAVLAALGVPEAPARPIMETLTEFLRSRITVPQVGYRLMADPSGDSAPATA